MTYLVVPYWPTSCTVDNNNTASPAWPPPPPPRAPAASASTGRASPQHCCGDARLHVPHLCKVPAEWHYRGHLRHWARSSGYMKPRLIRQKRSQGTWSAVLCNRAVRARSRARHRRTTRRAASSSPTRSRCRRMRARSSRPAAITATPKCSRAARAARSRLGRR